MLSCFAGPCGLMRLDWDILGILDGLDLNRTYFIVWGRKKWRCGYADSTRFSTRVEVVYFSFLFSVTFGALWIFFSFFLSFFKPKIIIIIIAKCKTLCFEIGNLLLKNCFGCFFFFSLSRRQVKKWRWETLVGVKWKICI